ncbi:RNA polymerase sigma factor SigJ [Conexibacter arvalis]|uniref:RNA polymerase sigma-70 factor (ECF subfamily) n=1 Tax=Conexibacter arvalis TaxID=912552 RepID=A0A840IG00_9ACTN|nr:RNA polymerase sigma factor SigJ [Conexibacter arvalis]MBB4662984.1 RNA polymerase sigma-70 factor (ECF subfamily) [Conexibacter arvalis]
MSTRSDEQLAAAFEAERPYLRRLAYGTLGSVAEADDVVQDAWLRLQRADAAAIGDLRAWLTTVVGRLALDALGTARVRRERYVGPWLPEPIVEAAGADAAFGPVASAAETRALGSDPADRVTLDEQVTTALLVVLERLSPAERTAFVLHDVFGLPFQEVSEVVGRTPAAVRQLAARARRHVDEGTPRFPASREEHARVVAAFAEAWAAGDVDGLLRMLDPDVTFRSDGGGKVAAARVPHHGAEHVAELLVSFSRVNERAGGGARGGLADVNGLPGIVLSDGDVKTVISLTVDRGRIVAIDAVRNPDKLRHVTASPTGTLPEASGRAEGGGWGGAGGEPDARA